MGLPDELILSTDNEFSIGVGKPDASSPEISPADKDALKQLFGDTTPLWYYILKEAEVFSQGRTLGPVGGRIVTETTAIEMVQTFLTTAYLGGRHQRRLDKITQLERDSHWS